MSKNGVLAAYCVIVVVGFIVFANSLGNGFVLDDETLILGDKSITDLSNIPKYFTGEMGYHKVIAKYYRPLISSSYAIDYAIWDYNPFGYHLTNVLINIVNSLLVFKFLLILFQRKNVKDSKKNILYILTGALIFAVHPVHTEVVAWVSGRGDLLFFTFYIAAFINYLLIPDEDKHTSKNKRYILTCFFYMLALFSKEMAITFPVVVILYDLVVEKYTLKKLINKKSVLLISLAVISLLYLFIRWSILKDVYDNEKFYYFYGKGFLTTLFSMLQTIPIIFKLIVFPVDLVYDYNGYLPFISSILNPLVILSIVLIIAMAYLSKKFIDKDPLISFSIIFFFVTLLPVLNIIPSINLLAERTLYLVSISLSIVFVCLAYYNWFSKIKYSPYSMAVPVLVFFVILTVIRNAEWKDNYTITLSAEGKSGTTIYTNLGHYYSAKNQLGTAEQYYKKALGLGLETHLLYINIADVLMKQKKFDEAYTYGLKAIELDTLLPESHYMMAQIYSEKNMIKESIAELEKVNKLYPNFNNSEKILNDLKNQSKDSTRADPNKISGMRNDAKKKYTDGDYNGAISVYSELAKIDPQNKAVYDNNIGLSYYALNKLDDALKYFKLAVEGKSGFAMAYNNLGMVYEKKGDLTLAKENYRKAFDSDPNYKTAYDNYNRLK
jgi:protein O-mannosyl-transferase